MSDLSDTIKELIAAHPEAECDLEFGPTTTKEIKLIEDGLKLVFPKSFRSYLEDYAGGMMFGYEIFGVPTEKSKIIPNSDDSVIVDIMKANEKIRQHFPMGHVFICCDGGDFQFFLDTAIFSDEGECPIRMYGPGADGIQIADNFVQFLAKLAEQVSFTAQ